MKKSFLIFSFFITLLYKQDGRAQIIPQFDHVVIVIMENHSYSSIIGSPDAPYINSLVNGTFSANFTQSYGLTYPSQPNYLMLFSGANQGVTSDSYPSGQPFTTPNLGAGLMATSYTFAGYSEDLPSVGYNGSTSGNYVRKHNPWVNWQNAPQNGIPSISNQPFTNFSLDFTILPTVSFVIPNQENNMHDPAGSTTAIINGDTWLQNNLDAYIQWAKFNNSLFILTFDEDDGSESNRIVTLFIGENILKGEYSEHIDHYTVLRTLEDMYGLPYAGNSAAATPITNCWAFPTEIQDLEIPESVNLFPNPAEENFMINFYSDRQQNVKIVVKDLLSKTIVTINKTMIAGDNYIQLPIENFISGTYFVNVVSSENNLIKKVVVKK